MKKNKGEQKEEVEQSSQQTPSKRAPSKSSFSKFCAFWGITLAAVLFVTNGILKIIERFLEDEEILAGFNSCMAAFDFIAKLGLLVAVAIPAYAYVSKKKLGWKITYIFAIVFYAAFCVYHLI